LKYIIISIFTIAILSAQSREDIFYEVQKSDKKEVKSIYPDLMLDIGAGYLFHENNKFIKKTYKDNFSLNFDVKKYFFKGSYLNLSVTMSNTEYGRNVFDTTIDSTKFVKNDYTYLSYYLGIDYFFNSVDFNDPWFFGFGVGSNNFFSNNGNINRFSLQLRFGKITDLEVLGGNLAFDVSALMFEDRGIQYYNDYRTGLYIPQTDWILFTTLKLSASIHYDISSLIN
jgi:hypothetical protein